MKIGILDILTDIPVNGRLGSLYANYFRRQFFGIAPQAVSVWCRQLGHEVHYRTYVGQYDPKTLLPSDLDAVFISAYTSSSALAYALAKLYRREGTLTVIGGPHARAFPQDCLRFFDLVVQDCDRTLIDDILSGRFDPPAIVTSRRPLMEIPTVEERRQEIETAAFTRCKPSLVSVIPLLSSIGCPYACNFCVDWDNPYAPLPLERLRADLKFISENWPGVIVGFHDPNFAVRFDEVMDVMETIPEGRRNRYIMESSLTILKEHRLKRLQATNCAYISPGIESWVDYSNKTGVGAKQGRGKMEQVLDHFNLLAEYFSGLQATLMFGTDMDHGPEPVELTKEFIRRLPNVWVAVSIPTPFGSTPLARQYMEHGRVLKKMPFALYYDCLTTTFKHYHPLEYYDHLIDIQATVASTIMLAKRFLSNSSLLVRFIHNVRTIATRNELDDSRQIRNMLASDKKFLAFHEGRSEVVPEYYYRRIDLRLGPYAELLSREDLSPVLNGAEAGREIATHPQFALAGMEIAKPATV